MYFLYILYSENLDRYYIGYTENIHIRLKEHLWEHKGFTSKAKDWELKYSETFEEKTDAMARERQIKKWKSRRLIERLISEKDQLAGPGHPELTSGGSGARTFRSQFGTGSHRPSVFKDRSLCFGFFCYVISLYLIFRKS